MRNIITKAGTLVLGILVCLLIIILGIQAYNKLIVNDETASILGYNYKTVLTGSMAVSYTHLQRSRPIHR